MGEKISRLHEGISEVKYFCAICFMLLVILPVKGLPQEYLDDPAEGMKIATIDYQNGDYENAYKKYHSLANRYSLDGHNSVFRFMAAKSLYKAGEYKAAIRLFNEFLDEFPRSRYAGAANLLKGHSLYMEGDLMGTAAMYIAAIDADRKNKSADIARENLRPLMDKGLSIWQLEQIIEEHPLSSMVEEMEFTMALREFESGRYRSGLKTLQSYQRRFPGGKHSREARSLFQRYMERTTSSQVIGLMVPISGGYKEYGRSMVEGARLAIKYLSGDSIKPELIVKDTQGDPVKAAKVAARLANEEPLAVIGPLRSESSVGAAIVLNKENIPMITPTASENGIASLGANIFQISPAIDRLGQAMATYAVEELGITEFAVISPDDAGGVAVSKAFIQTVYRLGGEVTSTSYYSPGETDFKQQIKPLREFLLMKTEEQLAAGEIDSAAYIDDDKIDPEYPDSVVLIDREEWPVRLGGLFLPGYPDALKLLIPQIRYHIIRTQFLGADGWDSEELIREVSRYVGNALFATDFHAGSDEVNWVEFAEAYSSEFDHPPDKVAALTFDAVALVLSGLRQGITSPEGLRKYLSDIEKYQGVSCLITFKGTGRANNEIRIYSINEGKVASRR